MMFNLLMHLLIQLGTIFWSRAGVTELPDFDVRETIAELVHDLCPYVDICDVNATSAELRPNEIVSRGGRVSCCQGCSCHPDCKEKDNCCYPDDYKSKIEAQPTTKLIECLYTRLGQPEMLNGLVPAYKTIVGEPKGGCVDTRPIRISPKVVLHPTCDDIDVTPLGPYYPVFSRDTGAIYKNVLCARCYGIHNTEWFLPNLVCNPRKAKTKEDNSMTDFLNFLETGFLSPECHVDFNFSDVTALTYNRCYRDVITTCTSQTVTFPLGFSPSNLSFDVVQSLCESGPNSPTVNVNKGLVYKNVFCALCGNTTPIRLYLQCPDLDQRTNLDGSLAFILNMKMMHTINKAPGPKSKKEVCLDEKVTDERSKQQKLCKTIYCPTGKIRNEDGDCELIGNYLAKSKGIVNIKLTPAEKIDLGNESQEAFNERIVQSLTENNPWPAKWEVDKIFTNMNFTKCEDIAIATVTLRWDKRDTVHIYDEIQESIRLAWLFEWNERRYRLTQSLIKYKFIRITGTDWSIKPSWQHSHSTNLPTETYLKCGSIRWKKMFRNPKKEITRLIVNKLFFCQQIQLRSGEFILGPERSYLESNLTRRTLYDLEFDIVEEKDGFSARVCLNDTILADNSANEGTVLKARAMFPVLLSMTVYFKYSACRDVQHILLF